MYNKLFTKILDSTIWLEDDATRLVWITFLAVMDEDGFVALSAPGNVAIRARVTLEAAETALKALESPDRADPSQDHDGRRIERVPYGWMVLNAAKYRDIIKRVDSREKTRLRVAKHRASNAHVTQRNGFVTPSVSVSNTETGKSTVGLKPDLKAPRKEAIEILAFLNEKTGRNYQPVPANIDMILARLKEGNSIEDCRAVIAKKCREWGPDEKMTQYLRPATLFNRTKFAQYRGEVGNG